jgi:hypothetical protein
MVFWYAFVMLVNGTARAVRSPDEHRIRDLEELTPHNEHGYVSATVGGKPEYIHRIGAAARAIAESTALPMLATLEVFAAHFPGSEKHSVNARFATASDNMRERPPSKQRAEPLPAHDDNWKPLKFHRWNAGPKEIEAAEKIEINDHGQLRREDKQIVAIPAGHRPRVNIGGKGYKFYTLIKEHHDDKPVPKGMVVDHIDRNTSNNSIDNLRVTTYSENRLNCDPDAARRIGEAKSDEIKVLVFKKGEPQPTREQVVERGTAFASTYAAAAQLQVDRVCLSTCANGTRCKTGIKGTTDTYAAAAWVLRDPFAGHAIKSIHLFSESSMIKLMERAGLNNELVAKHGNDFDYTELDVVLAKWNAWCGPTSRDYGVIKPMVHSVLRLYPHLAFYRVAYQRSYPGSPAQDEHTDVGPRNGPSYFTLLVPLDNPSPSEAGFTQLINPKHRLAPPRFGQGLLFRRDVAHFGTGNRTARNRDFVYFTFAPSGFKDPN